MSDLQKDVLGGDALAELAGPLKDFFLKLGGLQGKRWLVGFKRFLREEDPFEPFILRIDRKQPFNPDEFLKKRVKSWRIVEQDERALALTEVNIYRISFNDKRLWLNGEERLRRLKRLGYILLDAKILQTFLENKHLIPESWKKITEISFDGTVLADPDGRRYVFRLYYHNTEWCYGLYELNVIWYDYYRSALLKI